MAQLSLSITAVNIVVLAFGKPVLSLLIRRELVNRLCEHRLMKSSYWLSMVHLLPEKLRIEWCFKIGFSIFFVKMVNFFEPHFLDLLRSPLIVFVGQLQSWISICIVLDLVIEFLDIIGNNIHELYDLFLIEIAFGAFFNKFCCGDFINPGALNSLSTF